VTLGATVTAPSEFKTAAAILPIVTLSVSLSVFVVVENHPGVPAVNVPVTLTLFAIIGYFPLAKVPIETSLVPEILVTLNDKLSADLAPIVNFIFLSTY